MKISESVITRREFLNWSLTASLGVLGACVLYPIYKATVVGSNELEPENVTLEDFSVEKGDGRMFAYGKKPGLLIRKSSGELKAYSAVCTHFDCTVQYNKAEGLIWCPCHNGKYDLGGRVLSGPPPRPLEEYFVSVKGSKIIISKKGKGIFGREINMEISKLIDYSIGVGVIVIAAAISVILINRKIKDVERLRKIEEDCNRGWRR